MKKVSNDLLQVMIEWAEATLKRDATFIEECRLCAYLELKQLRAEREAHNANG